MNYNTCYEYKLTENKLGVASSEMDVDVGEEINENRLVEDSFCPSRIYYGRCYSTAEEDIPHIEEKYIYKGDFIGAGRNARVYKGYIGQEHYPVAIKEEKINSNLRLDALNEKILQEVKKLAKLRHENVIRLIGICKRINNVTMVIMELGDGGSLRSYLDAYRMKSDKIKLPFRIQVNWLKQIAEGMVYFNSMNLVHGDLKAQNIVLDRYPNFFNVKEMDRTRLKIIDISENSGTPSHMSPEAMNESLNEKSDVWSFGVVIYEVASLLWPFINFRSKEQIFYHVAIAGKTLEFPCDGNRRLKCIAENCWNYDPAKRISFYEILNELDTIECDSLSLFAEEEASLLTDNKLQRFHSVQSDYDDYEELDLADFSNLDTEASNYEDVSLKDDEQDESRYGAIPFDLF